MTSFRFTSPKPIFEASRRVEAGEFITIARGKTLVAKLVPIVHKGKREFGAMRGQVQHGPEFFEPNNELDP
jgi:antitoxin (DNA-binding transcriptional repressor) of toxin-antitoxin stability system